MQLALARLELASVNAELESAQTAEPISDWLFRHGFPESGPLHDTLHAQAEDCRDLKLLRDEELDALLTPLGLKPLTLRRFNLALKELRGSDALTDTITDPVRDLAGSERDSVLASGSPSERPSAVAGASSWVGYVHQAEAALRAIRLERPTPSTPSNDPLKSSQQPSVVSAARYATAAARVHHEAAAAAAHAASRNEVRAREVAHAAAASAATAERRVQRCRELAITYSEAATAKFARAKAEAEQRQGGRGGRTGTDAWVVRLGTTAKEVASKWAQRVAAAEVDAAACRKRAACVSWSRTPHARPLESNQRAAWAGLELDICRVPVSDGAMYNGATYSWRDLPMARPTIVLLTVRLLSTAPLINGTTHRSTCAARSLLEQYQATAASAAAAEAAQLISLQQANEHTRREAQAHAEMERTARMLQERAKGRQRAAAERGAALEAIVATEASRAASVQVGVRRGH